MEFWNKTLFFSLDLLFLTFMFDLTLIDKLLIVGSYAEVLYFAKEK